MNIRKEGTLIISIIKGLLRNLGVLSKVAGLR